MSAQLVLQNGIHLNGSQALKQMEAATQWQVELVQPARREQPVPPPPFAGPLSPSPGESVLPGSNLRLSPPLRQKRPLDPALLQSLPVRERLIIRSVFALINGRRGYEELKVQLPFSSWDIELAVKRLRALDLIE